MVVYDPRSLGIPEKFISKRNGDEYLMLCPFHNDEHPSASFNTVSGLFYCFACHRKSNAEELAKLFGSTLTIIGVDSTSTIWGGEVVYGKERGEEEGFNFASWPVASGKSDYLRERVGNCASTILSNFDIRYSEEEETVAFPFYEGDRIVGWQTRSINSKKYRTHGKKPLLWGGHGLQALFGPHNSISKIFITEGVFGVLRAVNNGIRAYALLGSGNLWGIRYAASFPTVYCYFDDDLAGWRASAYALGCGMRVSIIRNKAPDDLTDYEWEKVYKDVERLFTGNLSVFLSGIPKGERGLLIDVFYQGMNDSKAHT